MTEKRFDVVYEEDDEFENICYWDIIDKKNNAKTSNELKLCHLLNNLNDENEQLKQRNDRQAKRLAELYELMAMKDWESLTEIIDDFCSCEEQLQREWRTYE